MAHPVPTRVFHKPSPYIAMLFTPPPAHIETTSQGHCCLDGWKSHDRCTDH